MAENTYNWQSMDYKELSFVDKHLDMSLPEQVELRQQPRDRGEDHAHRRGGI